MARHELSLSAPQNCDSVTERQLDVRTDAGVAGAAPGLGVFRFLEGSSAAASALGLRFLSFLLSFMRHRRLRDHG